MIRRLMHALVFLCLVVWYPAMVRGQGTTAAPGAPARIYVLKAARMFDGKSNAIVKPGLVVVSGGRIVGVGAAAAIPAGAEAIDLGDATLLPGFIDAHTHLTMNYREDYTRAMLDGLQKTVPEKAIEATVNARITLLGGFTTVAH